MISLHSSGSPAETTMVSTLLEIIANPAIAQKHLDALKAEKLAAVEATNSARAAADEAKAEHKSATAKLAEARRITSEFDRDQKVRAKTLDDRHETLVAKDERLKKYEADVAAREAALSDRGKVVSAKEAELAAREAKVAETEAAAQTLKDQYATKLTALESALSTAKEI